MAVRNGGIVAVIGAYGGWADKVPLGSVMNRSLTSKSAQCHVQRSMEPLLQRVLNGGIDPSFVITHELALDDAPKGYDTLLHTQDTCVKVVLRP